VQVQVKISGNPKQFIHSYKHHYKLWVIAIASRNNQNKTEHQNNSSQKRKEQAGAGGEGGPFSSS
jgi:hypothetical protein